MKGPTIFIAVLAFLAFLVAAFAMNKGRKALGSTEKGGESVTGAAIAGIGATLAAIAIMIVLLDSIWGGGLLRDKMITWLAGLGDDIFAGLRGGFASGSSIQPAPTPRPGGFLTPAVQQGIQIARLILYSM